MQTQETRRRNAEIREVYKRRALYGDRKPTGLLTQREQQKLMKPPSKLRVFLRRLAALFQQGESHV